MMPHSLATPLPACAHLRHVIGHRHLAQQQAGAAGRAAPDGPQDAAALLVRPIVQDAFEEVGLSSWWGKEVGKSTAAAEVALQGLVGQA